MPIYLWLPCWRPFHGSSMPSGWSPSCQPPMFVSMELGPCWPNRLPPSPQASQPSWTTLPPFPPHPPLSGSIQHSGIFILESAPKISSFWKSFLTHHTPGRLTDHILLLCLSTDFDHCICTISRVCFLLLTHLPPSRQEKRHLNDNNSLDFLSACQCQAPFKAFQQLLLTHLILTIQRSGFYYYPILQMRRPRHKAVNNGFKVKQWVGSLFSNLTQWQCIVGAQ